MVAFKAGKMVTYYFSWKSILKSFYTALDNFEASILLIDAVVLDFVEEGMIFCFSDYNEILYGSFCKDYDYKEC